MKVRVSEFEDTVEEVPDDFWVMVAASRSRATEVQQCPATGDMILVEHCKSRDYVTPITAIPEYLTVRYSEPYPLANEPIEYAQA